MATSPPEGPSALHLDPSVVEVVACRLDVASREVENPPAHATMLSADPTLGRPEEWSLVPVPLPPAYHGTVAVRARVSLRTWWFPEPSLPRGPGWPRLIRAR